MSPEQALSGEVRTVALLGAGSTMGRGIAGNLAPEFEVRAWNRTPEKLAELAGKEGVVVCDSAREAADGADVVLTMLSDGAAVLATMEGDDGGLAGARPGATWLQMSTIGLEATARCAELAGEAGLVFVDAPVLGTRKPAEEGQLVVLGSGPQEAREQLEPLLRAVGKRTLWAGRAGTGSRLKVAVNTWIVTVVEGAAEMLALAEALGLDPQMALDAVKDGPLDQPYLQLKSKMMLKREFTPSFRLELAAKDAGLALAAAAGEGLELPMLAAIHRRLVDASRDHGDEDLAAVYLASSPSD
ncbi:MAG TPA: NAD(P)-dependent oxidoreductase [Solirubrobacterales bacterium]|nr:NAD(P)-dependent oxidoreductase [Solirubrobacterales bacterium]